jgi:flagellar motility protein MotE (MotC chaperone)
MEYRTLVTMRQNHPTWRLLLADHAPLIVSFLFDTFIEPNIRTMAQPELTSRLDDYLYSLRGSLGEEAFPREAAHYLDTWASDDHAWLRKYYPANSDEPHYDITPGTEKAIDWLASLEQRTFVGTESRLMTVFELLHQLAEGTETDPWMRIAELERRRTEIDAEIRRIRDGHISLLDSTRIKERFLQISATARELLSDFREVEQNFRNLDREVRERIATWDGSKGDLLEEIFGERDMIADSDQGKSFRAFWDFLMSPNRQDELGMLLSKIFGLKPVQDLEPDRRMLRVHYDWLQAGEMAQRTVARLSEQLRRYLDDKAWLDNRRIMQLVREIEHSALALRDTPPSGTLTEIDEPVPNVTLTMGRALFNPPLKSEINEVPLEGPADVPTDALFNQIYVDKERLAMRIRRSLQSHPQVSLSDMVARHPIEQGLAEIVAYFSIAADDPAAIINDTARQTLTWIDENGTARQATLPTVIFCRPATAVMGTG